MQKSVNEMNTIQYESPSFEIIELRSEGVLCQSGNFTLPKWEYDNEEQDFGW